ncbi:hypothetical protein BSQ44_06955 [Aquibium oceanicum]|uniref:Virulence-associated protein E-like domain-containing protein n=1 Tax=Aquibium oceanicum TaxID=1670800 RepID=A0A1L3SNY3_9HYPH|nr:hypothetical protein BSQ44_06955 [Aquibium oceanicum]
MLDPIYHTSFENVRRTCESDPQGRYGVGFVLTEQSGFVVVDIDQKIGSTEDRERVHQASQLLLGKQATYTEFSISGGGGFHIVYKGKLPQGIASANGLMPGVEIYAWNRFIAFTGKVTAGGDRPVADGSAVIEELFAERPEYLDTHRNVRGVKNVDSTYDLGRVIGLPDERVLRVMQLRCEASYNLMNADNCDDFSLAMLQIIGDLDKITGDPAQIFRIVARSNVVMKGPPNAAGEDRPDKLHRLFNKWMADVRYGKNKNTRAIMWWVTPEATEHGRSVAKHLEQYDENGNHISGFTVAIRKNMADVAARKKQAQIQRRVGDWYEWPDSDIATLARYAKNLDDLEIAANSLMPALHNIVDDVTPIIARALELDIAYLSPAYEFILHIVSANKVCSKSAAANCWKTLQAKFLNAGKELNPTWTDGLKRDQYGNPLRTMDNAFHVLTNMPEMKDLLAYDLFQQQMLLVRQPPWSFENEDQPKLAGQRFESDTKSKLHSHEVVTDAQLRFLTIAVQRAGIAAPEQAIVSAIKAAASTNEVDIVRDKFLSLKWDGVPRIDTWLTTYGGAEDNAYTRFIGAKWLISGAARALKPGCKVDHILMFQGDQGKYKTEALTKLAYDAHYYALGPDPSNKDEKMATAGMLIVDLAEADILFTKKGSAVIKHFATEREDRYRVPFGHTPQTFPRRFIMAGTFNPERIFNDSTGGRRFWIARVVKFDVAAIERDRDQLWAEAVHRYQAGEKWWPVDEEDSIFVEAAKEQVSERTVEDPWAASVIAYLGFEGSTSETGFHPTAQRPDLLPFVRPEQIMSKALGLELIKQDNRATSRVQNILQEIGYKSGSKRLSGSAVIRAWMPGTSEDKLAALRGQIAHIAEEYGLTYAREMTADEQAAYIAHLTTEALRAAGKFE